LNLFDGQEELFQILDMLQNVDYDPPPQDNSLRVMHCAMLPLAF